MKLTHSAELLESATAGTSRTKSVPVPRSPHAFDPERSHDWGYRRLCRSCGGERDDVLHEEPV